MQSLIGLAMIVKNEQANLTRCLESVKKQVHEMIIVDTGSTDKTVEIARQYSAKVFNYPWNDDFSAARNYAISQLTSSWVLILDADEVLDCTICGLETLLTEYPKAAAFYLPFYQTVPDDESLDRFPALRLFRRKPNCQFRGLVHEELQMLDPQKTQFVTGPVIKHISQSIKETDSKHSRNLVLLQKTAASDQDNYRFNYFLGLELFNLGRFQEALAYFKKAAALSENGTLLRTAIIRYLIRCLNALNQSAEAIGVCIKETKNYSGYSDLYYEGGVIFEQKQEYQLAIKWLQKAVAAGTPPADYYHTVGSDGYLALYHLGCCYEMQKQLIDAQNCYQQILASNPDVLKPLYNLFLLKMAELGPVDALRYFQETLKTPTMKQALYLAELLFDIGYYALANKCLSPETFPQLHLEAVQKARVKYQLFSGDFSKAYQTLERLNLAEQDLDSEMATEEILIHILRKDYALARKKAETLLSRSMEQNTAWALLNMISLCAENTIYGLPEKSRQPAVFQIILSIIERCLCYIPDISEKDGSTLQILMDLASLSIRTLTRLSADSAAAIVNYFQNKAGIVQNMMQLKFNIEIDDLVSKNKNYQVINA
jgi:glycosyltransferase involved in cell wall biosynthesis